MSTLDRDLTLDWMTATPEEIAAIADADVPDGPTWEGEPFSKGDVPGHDFHGNQYVTGESSPVSRMNPEGFTVHPYKGTVPKVGYQVGGVRKADSYPARAQRGTLRSVLRAHILAHGDLYSKTGNRYYVGGWKQGNRLVLEPSEHVMDRATAYQLGKDRNQVSIWDNVAKKEIKTGGTGVYKPNPNST